MPSSSTMAPAIPRRRRMPGFRAQGAGTGACRCAGRAGNGFGRRLAGYRVQRLVHDGNWSPAGVPGAATDVFINSSASNPTVINAGNAKAKNVTVGDSVTGTGILSITNAGKLASMAGTVGARAGSNGTVNISSAGGASIWTIANDLVVGQSGKGVLNINAGGMVSDSYCLPWRQRGLKQHGDGQWPGLELERPTRRFLWA